MFPFAVFALSYARLPPRASDDQNTSSSVADTAELSVVLAPLVTFTP
jgi:hypothetical protein